MSWRPRQSPGYSVTELLVASSVFLGILTLVTSLLVEWNRRSRDADFELDALNKASRAISYLTSDLRTAQYVYHHAYIHVKDERAGQAGRSSALADSGTGTIGSQGNTTQALNGKYIPLVVEDVPQNEVTPHVGRQFFPGERAPGAVRVLAMTSDQPYGFKNLKYIVYYLGGRRYDLVPNSRSSGATRTLVVRPLYRLEGYVTDQANIGWYSMSSSIATTPTATSGFQIRIDTNGATSIFTPDVNGNFNTALGYGLSTAADRHWKLSNLCDVVVGVDTDDSFNPFTLRNPHPYSNLGLYSPYQATISLRVQRYDRRVIRWSGGRPLDLLEVSARAFVGNIPMPQAPN